MGGMRRSQRQATSHISRIVALIIHGGSAQKSEAVCGMARTGVSSVNERYNEMGSSVSGRTATTHGRAIETSTVETSTCTILSRFGHLGTKTEILTTSKRMHSIISSRSASSITLDGSRFHHYNLTFAIHSQRITPALSVPVHPSPTVDWE